ncbi:MAG TPA: hypothetical protein VHS96_06035 [Bacteroidia bacterium]|nr:hypothetical protein [Bacteroidia bacterium]
MTASTLETPLEIRRSLVWMIVVLGLILVASTFWKKGRLGDNARSRFITVERLVERNTWAHIAPGDTTPFEPSIDVIKMGDRIYSSKPPLYPLIMAGEAKVLKAVTGWEFYAHRKDYLRFLIILNQILPYLLMLWVAMRWLGEFTQDSWTQHFMLIGMSLGLIAFGYTPEINNHSPGACLLFLSCHQVYRVWVGRERRIWAMGLIGLLLGLTVSFELPALAFGLMLLGLLLWRRWQGGLLAALGMLVPILPSMLVFHAISGEWKPFYLQGKLYRFEGSYWSQPKDSDLLQEPQALYFLKTLFGVKGLFFVTPLLLLPVAGILPGLRRRIRPLAPLLKALVLPILVVVAYYGLRTHNYGGDCIGMRWYIVFMPLLLFLGWPVVEWLGKSVWGKVTCILLLLLSLLQNAVALYMDCFLDIEKLF